MTHSKYSTTPMMVSVLGWEREKELVNRVNVRGKGEGLMCIERGKG